MTWLVLSDSGGGGAQAGQGEHITSSQEADNRDSDSAAAPLRVSRERHIFN